jgi:hypothetical protein
MLAAPGAEEAWKLPVRGGKGVQEDAMKRVFRRSAYSWFSA